jgi:hypothetical protein
MFNERKRSRRITRLVREVEKIDTALADSKRLIAEIDAALEHSRALMRKQALLHRS